MQLWMIDLFLVVLILGVTYALTSEGLWGAGIVFFVVLFSILVALNFYEPLAQLLANNVSALRSWADFICLSALFLVTLIVLKLATENIAPLMVRFPIALYQIGRLLFGLGGAALTVGFLLLVLQTAPVHRKIASVLDYKSKSPFGLALDRKVLGLFQWTTAYIFPTYLSSDDIADPDFGRVKVFDPQARWILDHQNARPFPEGSGDRVPEPESGDSPSGGGSSGDGVASSGANNDSPRIPGGTAGAAVGIAPQG